MTSEKIDSKLTIDETLVHRLVTTQFPEWGKLPVQLVTCGGLDNKTFRLGEHMLVRMPSGAEYAMQVEKEHQWLPKLAPLLPLTIPVPLALGEPTDNYPWKWSIYRWLEGETAASGHIIDMNDFACNLAKFLIALQLIDPKEGPLPGSHNFYRGGELIIYDSETRSALHRLKNKIDIKTATKVWEAGLGTKWSNAPVWIHGDISVGNLLVQDGRLSAVIDFGQLGIGDPACDLAIAWTLFKGKSREVFQTMLPLDSSTWARGRAWTLWKAAIELNAIKDMETIQHWHVIINEVLTD